MLIAEKVIEKLRQEKFTLCTVESCTGGLIASALTDVAGASSVYWGGWIVYDNSAKINLGVCPDRISNHGAVSQEVAQELAEKGLSQLKGKTPQTKLICVATTGIAGPSGGSKEKPVGLCFIAVAISGQETEVHARVHRFLAQPGDRTQIKNHFLEKALELVQKSLDSQHLLEENL